MQGGIKNILRLGLYSKKYLLLYLNLATIPFKLVALCRKTLLTAHFPVEYFRNVLFLKCFKHHLKFVFNLVSGFKIAPLCLNFIFGKRKKFQGTESDESGRWKVAITLLESKNCRVSSQAYCHDRVSWYSANQLSLHRSSALFCRVYSLRSLRKL